MRVALVVSAAFTTLAACAQGRPLGPVATPTPGISVAVYQQGDEPPTAVVDERRSVHVDGRTLVLADVDPAAALSSLELDVLAGGRLSIGACERDRVVAVPSATDALAEFGRREERLARARTWAETHDEPFPEGDAPPVTAIASPTVRCTAHGAPGTYVVRVLYVTSSMRYRVQHDVTMTRADRAVIASRFSIVAPRLGGRADLRLFEGAPGGMRAPREVARGTIALDGSTTVLVQPTREVPVSLRRVFAGALTNGVTASSDLMWGRNSTEAIWVWLEAPGLRLARGPIHAHVAIAGEAERDVEVPAAGAEQTRALLRAPLWIDDELRGQRVRTVLGSSPEHIVDRVQLSVGNTGTVAREVWIEEPLRDARDRRIVGAWPLTSPVTLAGGRARLKAIVPAAAIERTGFTIAYDL